MSPSILPRPAETPNRHRFFGALAARNEEGEALTVSHRWSFDPNPHLSDNRFG